MGWIEWVCVVAILVLIGIAFKRIGLAVEENIPQKLKEISNQLENMNKRIDEIEEKINKGK